ncbi:hypothetical protein PISMIDRAFT_14045 [Pisolithus microcarpus 441]|uniref:Unplaced genomic scaffold scaffold_111, whole genome shotgun sequence n=1 Tax=Pisolithus microcarpus 441 TaxID=765257 RepID=A0A0C9Z8W1_9AGAM|nr:hypothetical protein PISMIDRAFT_14045 [Pisolithus microcarpus 441]
MNHHVTIWIVKELILMARTRLGTKKCTSGVAQPAQLAGHKRPRTLSSGSTASPPLSPLSSLLSSPILQEATHKERSNRFCYLCHDGGNTIACSNHICPRVICNACIKIPPEVEGILGLPEISFKCPACHEKEEHLAGSKPLPYFNEEKYFRHARLQHSSKESASELRSPKFAEGQS